MFKKIGILLYLQIKLTIRKLPVILVGTLIFSATVAFLLFGFLSAEKNRGASTLSRSTIGIINESSDSELDFILSYLGSMNGLSQLCQLENVSEEEGLLMLRDGRLDAVIYLPDGIINSILDGSNIPAKIILNNAGVNSSSALVQALVDAAAADLSHVQAGIYTIGHLADSVELSVDDSIAINQQINKDYIQLFLTRGKLFAKRDVRSTGSLTLVQYYLCSGFVLILLFSGISCASLLISPDSGMKHVLSRQRGVLGSYAFLQNLSVSLLYLVVAVTAFYFYGSKFSLAALFVIIFTSFSMNTFLYRICQNQTIAMLLICGLSVGMQFLAGGFIPSVFLPKTFSAIGSMLPAGCLFQAIQDMMQGTRSVFLLLCLGYAVLFNLLSGLFDCRFTQ